MIFGDISFYRPAAGREKDFGRALSAVYHPLKTCAPDPDFQIIGGQVYFRGQIL